MTGYDSTHRRLRPVVLARAGHRCEIVTATGARCSSPATHAGHIVARVDGGPNTLDNYRAECAWHSSSDGARIGNTRRRRNPADRPPLIPADIPPSFSSGAPPANTPASSLSPPTQPTRGFVVT